ncbi:MAG: diguanylate cyclase domain-containing protein [Cellulosilyticaceae bacterium]
MTISMQFISNAILNITLLSILIGLIYHNNVLKEEVARAYRLTSILTSVVIITEVLTVVFDQGGPQFRVPNIVANIVGFSLSTCIPIILSMIFDTRDNKGMKYMIIPSSIYTFLCLTSPWTGWVFTITSDNIYRRGPLFFVYILVYIWAGIILFKAVIKNADHFQDSRKRFIYMLFGIFILGTSIQIIFPQVHTSWYCITIILVSYYIFLCELQFKFDILTEVLNRQAFEKELQRLERDGKATIIAFDVNKFKEINDTYGHQKGDYYLKEVATYLKKSFHTIGKVYRIGGDEFCVLSNTVNEEVIERCLMQLEETMRRGRKQDRRLPLVAYGYSMYDQEATKSITDALKQADKKLYIHKNQ